MEKVENDEYNPIPQKYYNYMGKSHLSLDYKHEITRYNDVNIVSYKINNNSVHPFIQFLFGKSEFTSELSFPKIPIFKNLNDNELIDYTKVCLFGFLMLENYETFNESVIFDGFYEYKNSLYLFFDITKLNIQLYDIYKNSFLWFGLIDEILNYKHICNIKINNDNTQMFKENQDFCFLVDEKDSIYELPVVGFVAKSEKKLNYTYIFGETKGNKNDLLGPYYYFTDFFNAYEEASKLEEHSKPGIVRFAVFTGNVKYIENCLNDPIDDSEIKKQRLQDPNIDQRLERMTMRITDYDGNWCDKYDSVYLGNLELDDGTFLNKQTIVVREYQQQIPLSYHFIDKQTLNGERDDYLIL